MADSPTELTYPTTDRDDVVDTVRGVAVEDPYRWLEDPDSDRTSAWVAAQNAVTDEHLASLPSRPWFTERMRAILGSPRAGTPWQRGGRYLASRNDGTKDQDTIYVADSLAELVDGGRVLLDPGEFSSDATASLRGVSVSPDGGWAAYGVSEAGSDWVQWRLRKVETGVDGEDVLDRSKFSGAEWLPDSSGFFYLAYPGEGTVDGTEAAALGAGTLLLHRLGTDQAEDEVVFHQPERPRLMPWVQVTEDGRWLVIHLSEGTERRNTLSVRRIHDDIHDGGRLGPLLDVVAEPRAAYTLAGNTGDVLYLRTDEDAPHGKVVAVDLSRLEAGEPDVPWRAVVAEREETLEVAARAGSGLLAVYLDHAAHRLRRFGLDGAELGEVKLDGPVSVVGLNVHAGDDEVFLGVSSFASRTRAFLVDFGTGEVSGLAVGGDPGDELPEVVVDSGRAVSRDGTPVSYFLLRDAESKVEGPVPTLLYGYGGFDIALTPSFSSAWPAWLAAGGVVAIANLRGGGEYGTEWHEAGMLERKQNVFDDFIATAEDLVANGVTTPAQLAIHGRSNGGLLVGAVMTQRPELAAVALPMVGVLDMLRFHKFTIGGAWVPEFGDPDNPEHFGFLRAYSPLHNVREGTSYPPTLVLTGDHDDRVVPAHSYKFLAALQRAQAGGAPVLGRIETATGHGMGKPVRMLAAEFADMLAFAAAHTGLVPPD